MKKITQPEENALDGPNSGEQLSIRETNVVADPLISEGEPSDAEVGGGVTGRVVESYGEFSDRERWFDEKIAALGLSGIISNLKEMIEWWKYRDRWFQHKIKELLERDGESGFFSSFFARNRAEREVQEAFKRISKSIDLHQTLMELLQKEISGIKQTNQETNRQYQNAYAELIGKYKNLETVVIAHDSLKRNAEFTEDAQSFDTPRRLSDSYEGLKRKFKVFCHELRKDEGRILIADNFVYEMFYEVAVGRQELDDVIKTNRNFGIIIEEWNDFERRMRKQHAALFYDENTDTKIKLDFPRLIFNRS